MPRESKKAKAQRAVAILERLRRAYPGSRLALDFASPFQLLVALVLAAQCTDKKVNEVTPPLFRRYPAPADFAAADLAELEEMVHPTGFYRNKARALQALGRALVTDHDGTVPDRLDGLVALPGVGRKTANAVLGHAFGKNEGIVVDTHVQRLAGRLGLTAEKDPVKVEQDLLQLLPRADWTAFSHLLQDLGRAACQARKPLCGTCPVAELCPSAEVVG
ncbi:MAG TPA: endonuclease III [Acidobacteria bacterium]|nr:endonuclease III [Acidobacteriota bacterium]